MKNIRKFIEAIIDDESGLEHIFVCFVSLSQVAVGFKERTARMRDDTEWRDQGWDLCEKLKDQDYGTWYVSCADVAGFTIVKEYDDRT